MNKIILTVYIVLNGDCYQDRVVYWGSRQEFHLIGSRINYHAEGVYISPTPAGSDGYTFYAASDTLYAVRTEYKYGYLMIVNRFQINKLGEVRTIDAAILSHTPCNLTKNK